MNNKSNIRKLSNFYDHSDSLAKLIWFSISVRLTRPHEVFALNAKSALIHGRIIFKHFVDHQACQIQRCCNQTEQSCSTAKITFKSKNDSMQISRAAFLQPIPVISTRLLFIRPLNKKEERISVSMQKQWRWFSNLGDAFLTALREQTSEPTKKTALKLKTDILNHFFSTWFSLISKIPFIPKYLRLIMNILFSPNIIKRICVLQI